MSKFTDRFSRIEFTPRQLRLLEIQDHMRRTINDVALLFAQACHGFSLLRVHLESEHRSLLAQLTTMLPKDEAEEHYNVISQLLLPYHAPENLTIAPSHCTLQAFHSDVASDSPHLRTLNCSLLIALNAHWEHTWRPEISKTIGRGKKEDWIPSDFWGEVCKVRDCFLHNKAKANSDYVRRAKILKWFKDGDPIEITSTMFADFIFQSRVYCESFILDYFEESQLRVPKE